MDTIRTLAGVLTMVVLYTPFVFSYGGSLYLLWRLRKANWSVAALRKTNLLLGAPLMTFLLVWMLALLLFPPHVPAMSEDIHSLTAFAVVSIFTAPLIIPLISNLLIIGLSLKGVLGDATIPLWRRIFFAVTFIGAVLALLRLAYAVILSRR